MPSNRIERINEDIQRTLASLLRDIKDPRLNQGIVSVSSVDTTADLKHAKVYLSVFSLTSESEFLKGLKSASGFLRRELARSLSLRNTPELIFEIDKSIERGAKINELLQSLDITDSNNEGGDDDKYDGDNYDDDDS